MAQAAEDVGTRLPDFEGQEVRVARLKINGLSSEQTEALEVGTTVFFIVEAEVKAVEHTEDEKVGLIRLHKGEMQRHAACDPSYAKTVLDKAEKERAFAERQRKDAVEEAAGVAHLPLGEPDETGDGGGGDS